MSRILKRPMFRKGGLSQETGIMSGLDRKGYAQGSYAPRVKYQTGFPGVLTGYQIPFGKTGQQIASEAAKKVSNLSKIGSFFKSPTFSERGLYELAKKVGTRGSGIASAFARRFPKTGPFQALALKAALTEPGEVEKEYDISKLEKLLASSLPGAGQEYLPLAIRNLIGKKKEEEPEVIPPPPPEKIKDPEKSLMDVYGENKGIIDEVMGSADEDTKKSMYLQLAKFGAGLAAQPGGDLVGAIGRAAEKPLEGVEGTLAEKRKSDRQTKLMALQKTFDDMKEPEQIKLVKAIQKEYGFDSFKEAYDYVSRPKRSSAEIRADDEFYRKTATEMDVSTEGFRREMQKLDDLGLGDYVGYFTRTDAKLPEKPEDRIPGEYYVDAKGRPVRYMPSLKPPLQQPQDTGFKVEVKPKKTK